MHPFLSPSTFVITYSSWETWIPLLSELAPNSNKVYERSKVKDNQHHSVKVTKQEARVNIDSLCVPTFFLLGNPSQTKQGRQISLDLSSPPYATKSINERSKVSDDFWSEENFSQTKWKVSEKEERVNWLYPLHKIDFFWRKRNPCHLPKNYFEEKVVTVQTQALVPHSKRWVVSSLAVIGVFEQANDSTRNHRQPHELHVT